MTLMPDQLLVSTTNTPSLPISAATLPPANLVVSLSSMYTSPPTRCTPALGLGPLWSCGQPAPLYSTARIAMPAPRNSRIDLEAAVVDDLIDADVVANLLG